MNDGRRTSTTTGRQGKDEASSAANGHGANTLKARSNSSSEESKSKSPHVTFTSIEEFRNESTIDPPENFLINYPMRPRSLSHHLSATKIPSRKWLKIQATFWRTLMSFAMHFHSIARGPKPPKPAYKRTIATDTIPVELLFYLPDNYYHILRQKPHHRFPCVVNFHGGGFSLGDPRDDRYWARVCLQETEAVFVSVGYRRAPEHPFPTAVDDSADALLYISDHSQDLHIDSTNIALSGFSAGANLVFSVPLRLAYHRKIKAIQKPVLPPFAPRGGGSQLEIPHGDHDSNHLSAQNSNEPIFHSPFDTPSPSVSHVTTRNEDSSPTSDTDTHDHADNISTHDHDHDHQDRDHDHHHHNQNDHIPPSTPLNPQHPPTISYDFAHRPHRPGHTTHHPGASTTSLMLMRTRTGSPLRITSIVAWYPLLDWTQSRSSKKRNSLNPPKCLPKTFTDLFDHAYLPPPDPSGSHASPYASPGLAPNHMLTEALPPDIQLWLCEWDMLLKEGQTFSSRLEALGKNVDSKLIPRVPHGFDKSPNPFRDQGAIDELYVKAARGLKQVFSNEYGGLHSSASSIREDIVQRQPRRSVVPGFG